jgi:hypothetical protein
MPFIHYEQVYIDIKNPKTQAYRGLMNMNDYRSSMKDSTILGI